MSYKVRANDQLGYMFDFGPACETLDDAKQKLTNTKERFHCFRGVKLFLPREFILYISLGTKICYPVEIPGSKVTMNSKATRK